MNDNLKRMRLHLGGGPQRPHGHLSVLRHIDRRQRPAMLLREVEVDRQRPVQDETVVVDRGDVAVRVDREELGRARVQGGPAASGVSR